MRQFITTILNSIFIKSKNKKFNNVNDIMDNPIKFTNLKYKIIFFDIILSVDDYKYINALPREQKFEILKIMYKKKIFA